MIPAHHPRAWVSYRSSRLPSTNKPRRTDLHEILLDRYGTRGEALYMLVCGFLAIAIVGLAAHFLGQPLLFPSLWPTVFTLFRQPLDRAGEPAQRRRWPPRGLDGRAGFLVDFRPLR